MRAKASTILASGLLGLVCCTGLTAGEKSFDAAAAFGARPSVLDMSISPDGQHVAFISPAKGQGSVVFTVALAGDATPHIATEADGDPFRLTHCDWLSNERLVCEAYGIQPDRWGVLAPYTRLLALDASGANVHMLSTQTNEFTRGEELSGGGIIDWLPDQEGSILMTRLYLPDAHLSALVGSSKQGLGLDRIDTRSSAITVVEPPDPDVVGYLTDGHGAVRIMSITRPGPGGQSTGLFEFSYRLAGSRAWHPLSHYNSVDRTGFEPLAVDRDLNIVYGLQKLDGRMALYSRKLDATLAQQLVYARPDVDVRGVFRVGHEMRVVGATYVTESVHTHYLDPKFEQVMKAVLRAFPRHVVLLIGASADESRLLFRIGSDSDPGVYYLLDRTTHHLGTLLAVRTELQGAKLATVQPVTYPATDGVSIPAYLTLPPGRQGAKGLPAIVMPHGGPSARDQWGFDWLAQFFANRGYAVLQPNYRGSSGYGDAWSERNGFKSWKVAIGDVLDAGRWLVREGIADPGKLAIVGWSYGGYAALQSAVVDPGLFKAVVAIAPVTDLAALKDEHADWNDYQLVSDFVGNGASMHEGSPAEHADRINVPVLMFQGTHDINVRITESRLMAARLKAAGKRCELVTWDKLDDQLDDSQARTQMLRKSDAFLRQSLGL